MRIAFYGSSLLSSYWNGAATYYRGLLSELAKLGHAITFYEPDAFDRQANRDIEPPDWARVVVYPATEAAMRSVVAEAAQADVVVKASGVGVFDDALLRETMAAARPDAIRIFWDVDAPATLAALRAEPDHPLHAALRRLDFVMTYGGGDPVVEAYTAFGAARCVPIYNALDPASHHPVPPDPAFAGDLNFLANRLPDREARVEQFFLAAAERLPDRRFLLGGSGWHDKPMPPNVRAIGHVPTAAHNAFNCSRARRAECRARQHGRGGLFARDPRVRGGRGGFLPDHRRLARDRAVSGAGRGDPGRAGRAGCGGPSRGADARAGAGHRRAGAGAHPGRAHLRAARAAGGRLAARGAGAEARERHRVSGPLRIVVLGLSLSSSWGNGHATTYRALLKALAARGHDILFLERDKPWYAEHRDLDDPPYCTLRFYDVVAELERWREQIAGADAVLLGSYLPDGVAVIRAVQAMAGGVTAFYDIDTPVTLAKLQAGEWDYLSPDARPRLRPLSLLHRRPDPAAAGDGLRRAGGARAVLLRRSRPLSSDRGREAVGSRLSRHLQPRSPARAGAAAARTRSRRGPICASWWRGRNTRMTSRGPAMSSAWSICRPPRTPISTPACAGR